MIVYMERRRTLAGHSLVFSLTAVHGERAAVLTCGQLIFINDLLLRISVYLELHWSLWASARQTEMSVMSGSTRPQPVIC